MTNKEFNFSMMKFSFVFLLVVIAASFFHSYKFIYLVTNFFSSFIPAINRYGNATLFSDEARAIFSASWCAFPFLFPWYMKLTNFGSVGEMRPDRKVVIIFIVMFFASFFALFYGIYSESNLGDSVGIFQTIFIHSIYGVYVLSYVLWICFYITFGLFLNKIRSYFLGDKND